MLLKYARAIFTIAIISVTAYHFGNAHPSVYATIILLGKLFCQVMFYVGHHRSQ